MNRVIVAAACVGICASVAQPQGQPTWPPPANQPQVFFYQSAGPAFHHEGKPVLNAPYQAQTETQTTQHLADGNVIQNKHTSKVARDSQGRTWTEQTIDKLGPWSAADSGPHTIVFISDPVAGTSYVLHPEDKTAEKMPAPTRFTHAEKSFSVSDKGASTPDKGVSISAANGAPPPPPPDALGGVIGGVAGAIGEGATVTTFQRFDAGQSDAKTEDLGTQQINGVTAQGKRTTMTIPANTMGNQLPIVTVTETWYSPELQTIVQSKRDDPRMGESTFSLTNIQKGEPPADLFQVPSDYTVNSHPHGPVTLKQ